MPEQFFVIGGRYEDLEFNAMIDGTAHVFGPYKNIEEARGVWKQRAEATRSDAKARYAIVTNANAGRPQAA